jgi:hypothetical protein
MLGRDAVAGDDAMLEGDIVLVPNMPQDGHFTLCRITGPYDYDQTELGDFGHKRPVEVLLQDVANDHKLVDAGLRRSLRCRSRLWWVGGYDRSLRDLLNARDSEELSIGSGHLERANSIVKSVIDGKIDGIAKEIAERFGRSHSAEEWEPVLQAALRPLMMRAEVIHTGGPTERGADLEIILPNPFSQERNWAVLVQVKDYAGEVGVEVAEQLVEAIEARSDGSLDVIEIVLAATNAKASEALEGRLEQLTREYGKRFSFIGGSDLMKLLARGFMNAG